MAIPDNYPMGRASDSGQIYPQAGVAKEKSNLKSKCTVLFSSGIDSLACLLWAKEQYGKFENDVTAMYVDMHTKYSSNELYAARWFMKKYKVNQHLVGMGMLGELEGGIGHIPMRNIFLLELAALYSDNIVFGMLKGELSEDKGPSFIRRMQKLFDSQTVSNLYHPKSKITIHTPFSKMTKTQVVSWLLSRGVTKEVLRKTIGCLNGNVCGDCVSCFNRWVAFENNDIGDTDFSNDALEMHPCQWGINELLYEHDSTDKILWKKRRSIIELWKAYNKAHARGLTGWTSYKLLKAKLGI
jgi:7-cyano-7-deazaguanine synthase in queuosine biosynthesis